MSKGTKVCERCNGTGYIKVSDGWMEYTPNMYEEIKCSNCNGTGVVKLNVKDK